MRASGHWEEVNDLRSINGLHARVRVISSGKLTCMHAEPRRPLLMRLSYAKTFLEPIRLSYENGGSSDLQTKMS